jgi:murein DD-endopeptidase MepM/ murein hydrolase activator NlpD
MGFRETGETNRVPATTHHRRATPPLGLRIAVSTLVLVLLCSIAAVAAAPVQAANLPDQIGAARSSQLAYERAMRAADGEIKRLKRAEKQAQRNLKKATRTLRQAVKRRHDTKRNVTTTRTRLQETRATLAATSDEHPPPPDTVLAILALNPATAPAPESPPALVPATDQDLGLSDGGLAVVPSLALRDEAAVAEVAALEQKLKKQKRAYKKAKQRARRTWQRVRATRTKLGGIRASRRGATARREGAEAALAYRILSMSRLAQQRLAKKSDVRRATDTGLAWPARGRISQGYGCTGFYLNPPRGSCRHFHDGIDIVSYRGSPIRSAAVGVVSYIGWNPWDQRGRAFIIVVAHPGGYETVYGHVLPTRRVFAGQLVAKGETIGFMGNTGRSTGTHLHFELRRSRTTLNPLTFL